jgi:hypothetical protein
MKTQKKINFLREYTRDPYRRTDRAPRHHSSQLAPTARNLILRPVVVQAAPLNSVGVPLNHRKRVNRVIN